MIRKNATRSYITERGSLESGGQRGGVGKRERNGWRQVWSTWTVLGGPTETSALVIKCGCGRRQTTRLRVRVFGRDQENLGTRVCVRTREPQKGEGTKKKETGKKSCAGIRRRQEAICRYTTAVHQRGRGKGGRATVFGGAFTE